ncbi:MAG: calcium-binding protein [Gammaproteobacteria bacterium]
MPALARQGQALGFDLGGFDSPHDDALDARNHRYDLVILARRAIVIGSRARLVTAICPSTMLGTAGNDTLRGTFFGRDVILGLGGNDTIRGLGGDDVLCGGRGNDVLIGGDDTDRLYGGRGNDKLFGDRGLSTVDGDDSLYGGPGRDTLVADGGADLLFGEGSNDRLLGDAGQDMLDGGDGRDRCRDRLGSNAVERCESGRVRRPAEPARDPAPSNPSPCPPSSSSPCTRN